jgi:hypothetical protein
MDEIERRSALFAQLVKVLIHQETIFSNWIKFAITIQGGLVAGLGFVLSSKLPNYRALGIIIALLGAVTALFFALILPRHTQWAAWYVSRGNRLAPEIFPRRRRRKLRNLGLIAKWVVKLEQVREFMRRHLWFPPDEIAQQKLGPVVSSVRCFLWSVTAAWIGILVWLACRVAS